MPETLTLEQEVRLEAEVRPLNKAAYQHEQAGEREESFRLGREALVRTEAIILSVAAGMAAEDMRRQCSACSRTRGYPVRPLYGLGWCEGASMIALWCVKGHAVFKTALCGIMLAGAG